MGVDGSKLHSTTPSCLNGIAPLVAQQTASETNKLRQHGCLTLASPSPSRFRFISKTYTGRGPPQATTDRVSASSSVAGQGPGSAHVTHMAYLTDDLSNGNHGVGNKDSTSWFAEAAPAATGVATADDAPPKTDASHFVSRASPLAEPALAATWRHGNPPAANVGNVRRHSGFWGVWEPVLGPAGDGGGQSTDHGLPSRWRTTLSRRGGVFRLVPSRGTPRDRS